MKIIINHSSMIPIYEQIVNQIKNQIVKGELQNHDALPSVRLLSKELKDNKGDRVVGVDDIKKKFKSAMDEYLERAQEYL